MMLIAAGVYQKNKRASKKTTTAAAVSYSVSIYSIFTTQHHTSPTMQPHSDSGQQTKKSLSRSLQGVHQSLRAASEGKKNAVPTF